MLRFAALLIVLWPGLAAAQSAGPRLPCDAAAWSAAATPGADPAVGVWRDRDLRAAAWSPPRCAGWDASSRSRLIVTLAGTFNFNGTLDDLLARIGAISGLRRQRYWSVSDGAWRPLVSDAAALAGPDAASRRADFAPAELRQAEQVYYSQDDGRAGAVVYRMRVRASGLDQAVVEMENVTPIRYRFITLFDRGSLQVVMFIRKLRPGVWGAYTATRVGDGASSFAVGREASYVNRAAALYRLVAGIPSDAEPPPAR